jgi:hypothetical protein
MPELGTYGSVGGLVEQSLILPGNDEIASLRQFIVYKNRQNTLFKIRCWTFDVRRSSFNMFNVHNGLIFDIEL